MNEKKKASFLSEIILRFIYIYRHKYVAITEIEAEFKPFNYNSEIVNAINHLAKNDYIYIVKTSGVAIESISKLDENVFLCITLSGVKMLYALEEIFC